MTLEEFCEIWFISGTVRGSYVANTVGSKQWATGKSDLHPRLYKADKLKKEQCSVFMAAKN